MRMLVEAASAGDETRRTVRNCRGPVAEELSCPYQRSGEYGFARKDCLRRSYDL